MSDVAPTQRGVLDTNTVILLPRLQDVRHVPALPAITTITLAELSVGPLLAATEAERAARLTHVQQVEADFEPIAFDAAAARAFGHVAADLRRAGRKPAARAYDALIAATAIANGLPLFTVNPDDYQGITNLTVVPIPHPDAQPQA